MLKGILGRKLRMTQVFGPLGAAIPVTAVECGPCYVIQIKTKEKDGYNAVQLGFLPKKESRVNKPMKGHFDKAGVGYFYYLKEIRVDEIPEGLKVGDKITVDVFRVGEYVDVTGWSKGRGFTGVMKRWNFKGSAKWSHGTHEYFRHGGSIGSSTFPGRVFKGKKMPGRYGNERVTVQNLQVIDIRPEANIMFIKGAIPGPRNGLVIIRQSLKKPVIFEEE